VPSNGLRALAIDEEQGGVPHDGTTAEVTLPQRENRPLERRRDRGPQGLAA
jgi:hypothetical protein